MTQTPILFEQATPRSKRFKIMLFGPPGCYKTRVMLRLANREGEPALAVVDPEFGTDHYADEFNFKRVQKTESDEIQAAVEQLIENPGKITCVGFDSYSVYYEALVTKYNELFLKRETGSKGNRIDYYVIQPKDYPIIYREAYGLVRKLLKCSLHVIAVCQMKEKWQDMKPTGESIYDGPKRLAHYFDTVIEIQPTTDSTGTQIGWKAFVHKDRTRSLPMHKWFPWNNDEEVVSYLIKQFKTDLATAISEKKEEPAKTELKAEIKAEIKEEPQAPPPPPPPPKEQAATPPPPPPAATPTEEMTVIESLRRKAAMLKKELRMDKATWVDLLKPFGVASAMELDEAKMKEFVEKVESLRPSKAQSA